MSTRTVVVVSNTGRLIDANGVEKEANSHYKKFADRLLGDNSSSGAAVINYSWNGRNKLIITGAGGAGSEIELDASEVVVPSTLRVGGSTLGELLSLTEAKTLNGIRGTAGQIELRIIDNTDSSSSSEDRPDRLCILSISNRLLNRLDNLEAQVSGMLRFDDIYYAGDGIEVDHVNKRIGVRLGIGLTFEEVMPGSDSSESSGSDSPDEEGPVKAIAVDIEGIIEAVEEAIAPVVTPRYVVDIDSTTGNAILYRNDT